MLALPSSLLPISQHSSDHSTSESSSFCYNPEDFISNTEDAQQKRERKSGFVERRSRLAASNDEKSQRDDSQSTCRHRRSSVSEKISLYESLDTSNRDDSQAIYESPRRDRSSILGKLAIFEYGDLSQRDDCEYNNETRNRRFSTGMSSLQSMKANSVMASGAEAKKDSPVNTTIRATSLSPVKAVQRIRRGKLWETASVYEKDNDLVDTEEHLESPRRKTLPDALKSVFDVFESQATCKNNELKQGLNPLSLLDSLERNIVDRFEQPPLAACNRDTTPTNGLEPNDTTQRPSALKQKLEQLCTLTQEKIAINEHRETHVTKQKRRRSVGNGFTSGETVEEKMSRIDRIFDLHHEVKGTQVGTLKTMQEKIKEAHRDDFEREVWEENRRKLLEQYKKKLIIESLQRQIARAKAEVEAMIHHGVIPAELAAADRDDDDVENTETSLSDSFHHDSTANITLVELISCSDLQFSDGDQNSALHCQRILSCNKDTNKNGRCAVSGADGSAEPILDEETCENLKSEIADLNSTITLEDSLVSEKGASANLSCNTRITTIPNDESHQNDYSVNVESDSDEDSTYQARMKRADRLLAKSSKYLGKGSSSAHSSPVRKKGGVKKIREVITTQGKGRKEKQSTLSSDMERNNDNASNVDRSGPNDGRDSQKKYREIFARDKVFTAETSESEDFQGEEAENKRYQLLRKISKAQSEAKCFIIASNNRGRRASMSLAFAG